MEIDHEVFSNISTNMLHKVFRMYVCVKMLCYLSEV